jgi:hypothetical protein
MSPIGSAILVLGLLAAGDGRGPASAPRGEPSTRCEPVAADDVPAKKPSADLKKRKLRFIVGVATTHVSGPLDRDGYVDYEAALNELLRGGTTPANNAAVPLWKAIGPRPEGNRMPAEFFKWMGMDEPPEQGNYYVDEFRFVQTIPFDTLVEHSDAAGARPWTAKDYPHLAGWLKAIEKPLALVVEGTKRSHYYAPLVAYRGPDGPGPLFAALVPGAQRCRSLARTLCMRAMLHLGEGRPEEAWQDLLACHRLARHVGHGATLIDGLVGFAIDLTASGADVTFVAHAKRTPQQLRECLRDLQRLPPLPSMGQKIDRFERLICLDMLLRVERSGGLRALAGLFGDPAPPDPDSRLRRMLENLTWDATLRTMNHWFDGLADATLVRERGQRVKQLVQVEQELKALKKRLGDMKDLRKFLLKSKLSGEEQGKLVGEAFVVHLLPAATWALQAGDRDEQVRSNVRVAFALARYQRERGRYPQKLDELAPAYLARVPGDLFSGRPLIYRPSEKGYLLYSVGMNGRDDGGHDADSDSQSDDLTVRMPPPRKRPN